jgi:integrase
VFPSAEHGVGKRWQVRYRDPSGEQKKENCAKRTAADARAAEITNELDKGEYVDRVTRRQTLRDYAEEWRTTATHRERTESNVERGLRLHVYPLLGPRQIASIKRSDIRAWVKDRSAVLAPSSLRTPWNALFGVMAAAHYDGIIRANPCHGIDLPEIRKPEVVPLDPAVVRALLAATSSRYRALMRLAATTGLRQAELFGLEAEHVDLLAGTVEVEQQLIGPDKGVPYIGEPKTEKSYRTVPLSVSAVAAMEEHLKAYPPTAVEIEDRTDPRKPRTRKARLLFVSETGDPIRRGSWAKLWGAHGEAGRQAVGRQRVATARSRGDDNARSEALLRLGAHQARRVGEEGAAAPRSRQAIDHLGSVRASVRGRRGHYGRSHR